MSHVRYRQWLGSPAVPKWLIVSNVVYRDTARSAVCVCKRVHLFNLELLFTSPFVSLFLLCFADVKCIFDCLSFIVSNVEDRYVCDRDFWLFRLHTHSRRYWWHFVCFSGAFILRFVWDFALLPCIHTQCGWCVVICWVYFNHLLFLRVYTLANNLWGVLWGSLWICKGILRMFLLSRLHVFADDLGLFCGLFVAFFSGDFCSISLLYRCLPNSPETRFAEIRVRGWCLPDLPKHNSSKLGFRVRVRV